jgi:hypothetical protein
VSTAPADLQHHYDQLERDDEQRRARLAAPDALTLAASWYATVAGWPVFPLKPRGKTPLTRNGFKDATVDPEQVKAWWAATPQANIGTPTGIRFDVIDVDGPAGYHSLAVMRHADCPPDCCAEKVCWPDRTRILGHAVLAESHTGGGGRHILIPPTGQGNGTRLMPGIDHRGDGGYIVLPVSVHESGERYGWITPPDERLFGQAVT